MLDWAHNGWDVAVLDAKTRREQPKRTLYDPSGGLASEQASEASPGSLYSSDSL